MASRTDFDPARDRCPTCGRGPQRTTQQNRRLWALYGLMARHLQHDGQAQEPKFWHELCKTLFLGATDVRIPNPAWGKGGFGDSAPRTVVVSVPHSTADLDVHAFNEYMEQIEAFIATEFGIHLDQDDF